MKMFQVSDNHYINLDLVTDVKIDPDDGDGVVHFIDSDSGQYLEKDEVTRLKPILKEHCLYTTEELYKRFGIPWTPKEDDSLDKTGLLPSIDDIIKSYPK